MYFRSALGSGTKILDFVHVYEFGCRVQYERGFQLTAVFALRVGLEDVADVNLVKVIRWWLPCPWTPSVAPPSGVRTDAPS